MKKSFVLRKKWQVLLFLVFSVTLILFFFQNCSKYQSNPLSQKGLSSSNPGCKVQPHFHSPFEESKVQIDLDDEVSVQSSSGGESGSETQKRELALLVDPLCLKQSGEPVEVLGHIVEVPSELEDMERAAVNLVFDEEIDLDQLTRDMDSSPCLVGITENKEFMLDPIDPSLPDSSFNQEHPDQQQGQAQIASGFNDPMASNQAHLAFLNHSRSVDIQNRITASVVVAVLDTELMRIIPILRISFGIMGVEGMDKMFHLVSAIRTVLMTGVDMGPMFRELLPLDGIIIREWWELREILSSLWV